MAIFPVDLRDPKGPVQRVMFPDDDLSALDARLQGYIDRGVVAAAALTAGAAQDKAVRNYALWQAFDASYTIFLSLPARTRKDGENSLEYLDGQIEGLNLKALEYKGEFEAQLPQPVPAGALPRTSTTPNRFVW